MRLTVRGWVVVYCLLAVAAILFLIWADSIIAVPGVDDARVDAEQLQ